uniref:hypothetical protein n=1 Tax=Alkaliphilus transvaalensis TaxID=114628 RepID=UPI00054EBECC
DFIRRIQSHKIKISAVKRTVEGVKHSLGNQKEVIFYNNGKDLFKALILSFVFILIGYVLIKLDSLWIGRITMISSGLSIAFLIFVLLARKRRPSVVVNQYGVYVGRGFFPGRSVEWKDIQKAYIFQNDGSDFAKIGGFSKILVIRLNKYLEESKADNTDEMIQDIQEVYDTVTQDELENIKEAMLEHTYEDMEIIQTMVNIPLEELLEIIKGMHKKYGNVV